jgi:hypothetical protein
MFKMDVRSIRVDVYDGVVELQYSGDRAGDSQAVFTIPDDPVALAELAQLLSDLAERD